MSSLSGGALDATGRPATLGVMGGGQLGRMFVHAAQTLGFATVVMDPDPTSPAGMASTYHIQTEWLDEQGLAQLLQRSSAITTEFENVPANVLITLGAQRWVAPHGESVAICQDRALEKQQFVQAGVPCAPHAVILEPADLERVGAELLPGILKTSRMGYDGKGQVTVHNAAELAAAWATLKHVPCVLERLLPLRHEISVVLARSGQGEVVHLPVQQNLHRDGVLAVTQVPPPDVDVATQQEAIASATRLAEVMGYVGVLCVEFFVLQDGRLVANEMAPRPHNSGHHSIDACDVSQFDLQVRVLAGLPLVAPRLHSPAVMLNLLGDLWFQGADGQATVESAPDWASVLELPGVHLHLYGKASPRRGRKMGHLTVTSATLDQARQTAREVATRLRLPVSF
jgi:5-(carboxyamino)imidazole ribonucleotide synthase